VLVEETIAGLLDRADELEISLTVEVPTNVSLSRWRTPMCSGRCTTR